MIIDICNKVNSFHREGGGGALAVTLKASLLLQIIMIKGKFQSSATAACTSRSLHNVH